MLCVLVGMLVAGAAVFLLKKRREADMEHLLYMLLFSLFAIILGGSLLYGLTNIRAMLALFRVAQKMTAGEFLSHLLALFGGSVYYGGLLAMLLTIYLYRRKKGLGRGYNDLFAVVIPLFHAFGRIGCFLGGCCYGMECSFGFTYRYAIVEAANGVSRLPVQLFEAVFNFVLFIVLCNFFRKRKYEGWLLHIYLYAYPIFRFVNEFFRGDAYRGIWWGLSTSQWISLMILIGNTIVVLRRKKKEAG